MLADFVNFLENAPLVSALVSSRIYPGPPLPQHATLPAITYNQISATRVHVLAGPGGKARRRIQVDCWAATKTEAEALADTVRRSLDGFYGSMRDTVVGSTRIDNEQYFFEEEAGVTGIERVSHDYIIAHLET